MGSSPRFIKGNDIEAERSVTCGCMVKRYPLPADADMLDWLIIKRSLDMEEKWAMQEHRHRDFEEYWFVIEGKGKFYVGDDVYDVEPGDLAIMPRGTPHRAVGDITFVCCTALHNVYGQCIGRRMQYEATDSPYRDHPEIERGKLGEYIEKEM